MMMAKTMSMKKTCGEQQQAFMLILDIPSNFFVLFQIFANATTVLSLIDSHSLLFVKKYTTHFVL